MKGLVILDPEAPGGCRPVPGGVVANGKTLRSVAMKRLIDNLVREQIRWAERERREAAWVERQMANAPALTMVQMQLLRRLKRDLTKSALTNRPEPVPRHH
ncbi:hypothetical protein [Streptomyces sp. NPDC021020]|uniref:hypothetical protein n=1 Tax=Streptomyces sp. NPDC021020 TaxID=3365109 RepID=UPI0037BBB3FB